MRLHQAGTFLLAAISICGCAVQGDPFQTAEAPKSQAIIYVYRPYKYLASLLKPSVTCGEDTARIGAGGYRPFVVPPGKVVCSADTGETSDQVEIDAQPRVYYIKEQFSYGVWTGHIHLNPVDTDEAQEEIKKCCVLEK